MTPMVADVFALTCLPPMGAFADNLMASGRGLKEDVLNGVTLSYTDFIKEVKVLPTRTSLTRKRVAFTFFGYAISDLHFFQTSYK
jgi:hypothetical protein